MGGHDDGSVSPLAQTVPLTGEGRPTEGFTPGDQKRSSETSRVKREEIEHLLHRHSIEPAIGEDGHGPIIISVANDYAAPKTSELEPAPSVETASAPQSSQPTRRRPQLLRAAVLLCLSLVTIAALVAFFGYRKRAVERSNHAATASGVEAPSQPSIEAQLAEAESLLASGDTSGALVRLRAATLRDPSNGRAHRLLGEALERTGARVEAIAEYSTATGQDASDTAAWHALASAQFAEERYADAVESYRRLLALTGENGLDDNGQLEYADALRLAGYTEDARTVYQRVAAGAPTDLARRATRHLAELTTQAKSPAVTGNQELTHAANTSAHETRTELARNRPPEAPAQSVSSSPAPAPPPPAPQPSPATPGTAKTSVAQTDPDAYYFKAMSILGGRDPKSLPRPELLQALQLFQNAANVRGGAHREQARKYADRLGREFDRRPRQK